MVENHNFFPEFNILYDKNSESDFFFFLHQNQNIFFSNIGNQNIFLEKNHNPPLQVKWSFPNLRNNDDYRTQRCRLQTSSKYFFPSNIKLWNSFIPDSVKSLPIFSKLKKTHSACPNSGGFILQYWRYEN